MLRARAALDDREHTEGGEEDSKGSGKAWRGGGGVMGKGSEGRVRGVGVG